MKVLIISNMEGGIDALMESLDLEGVTIVTREVAGDSRSLAKQASGLLSSGKFNLVVALPTNPIAANLTFNKYEGIVSAVCRDMGDVKSARAENSNVMIIKSPGQDVGDIISAFVKGGGFGSLKIKMPDIVKSEPQQRVQQQPQQEAPREAQAAPVQRKPLIQFRREESPEEPAEESAPRRPGISGWIKDSLGIIDAEKPTRQETEDGDGKGQKKDKKKR